MENIIVLSEAFNHGEKIPIEYTCDGKDISPQLTWTRIPDNTVSLALFMYDPDTPRRPFIHWVIFNISPSIRGLPKGVPNVPTLTPWPFGTKTDSTYQGLNDFSKVGYGGPCPPPGKPHRYFFKVYALSAKLNIPPGTSNAYVRQYMEGDILASGELMGIYGR